MSGPASSSDRTSDRPLRAGAAVPPAALVLDVDGVMTDGRSHYTEDGKVVKVFGPDDHDALCILRDRMDVHFVSGDRRGFPISAARIARDMGFPLELVGSVGRLAWIAERWPLGRVIYMGDGIHDPPVLAGVGYGIAPADADAHARAAADFVTERRGGDRAVAEAAKHVMDRFLDGAQAMLHAAAHGGGAAVAGGWSEPEDVTTTTDRTTPAPSPTGATA